MASDLASDWTDFNQFISRRIEDQQPGKTLEESLAEFRAYQRDLEAIRAKLKVSLEQSARGESAELDDEEFWKRVDKQLDDLGIPE